MRHAVKNHLLDVGCSEKSAEDVDRLCASGQMDDALHRMKVIRCELMEDLHERQRKLDLLDGLIRQTEKEIKMT